MGEHIDMTIPYSTPRSLLTFCGVAALTLGGLACAANSAAPPKVEAKTAAGLIAPVRALIGDAFCDHPSQCHVIGVGAKACGGPGGYLAWSHQNTDQATLLAAVQTQAEAEKEEGKAVGLLSNCQVTPIPPATCRPRIEDGKKTCQLGQGGMQGVD